MSETWHEERDRLVKLLAAVESGKVTYVDQKNMRDLQIANAINVAAIKARLDALNARLGTEA